MTETLDPMSPLLLLYLYLHFKLAKKVQICLYPVLVHLIISTACLYKGKGIVHPKEITFPSLNSPLHVCVNSARVTSLYLNLQPCL